MAFTKSETVSNVTFERIFDVKKSADEENVYFCKVVMNFNNGFPSETDYYCARGDDYAITGKWVYQQILDGNFDGELKQLQVGENPITGEIVLPEQPVTIGTQEL